MDENLQMVLCVVKPMFHLTRDEEDEWTNEFNIIARGRRVVNVESDYRPFIQMKYTMMMPSASPEERDRIVNDKVSLIKKKDRNEDGDVTLEEFLQGAMLSKLDRSICEENDINDEFTMEDLKRWLKVKCHMFLPDDKLGECAKSVMEVTYEGKESIDPYDFTGKLFDILVSMDEHANF